MDNTPHPFYHSTTIAIIDDNADFLTNFSLQLDEQLAYTLHPSPVDGLEFLNNIKPNNNISQQLISTHTDFVEDEFIDNVVVLRTSGIISELSNAERFRENSVVIVDYDMPQMNGIEFCKLLNNKNMKKILLTGVADEKVAVQAFNDNVIDKFIKKSDMDAVDHINEYIKGFQQDYFKTKTSLIKSTLNVEFYGFMIQPAFIDLFNKLIKEHKVREYYLTNNPSGYLMITANDKILHLIIQSDLEIKSHAEIVSDQEGPEELIEKLKSKRFIANFWQSKGYYSTELEDWHNSLYPATALASIPRYYYTLVESPPYYEELLSTIYTFDAYLHSLDEQQLTTPYRS